MFLALKLLYSYIPSMLYSSLRNNKSFENSLLFQLKIII